MAAVQQNVWRIKLGINGSALGGGFGFHVAVAAAADALGSL